MKVRASLCLVRCLLCPRSFVVSAPLAPILLFVLSVIPTSLMAQVTVYAEPNCPESGLKRTYTHVMRRDLSNQYYEGSLVSLDNSISSIRIRGGWEVLGCDLAGFGQCAAQLNTEGQVNDKGIPMYQDRCINLTTLPWRPWHPIPTDNEISSLMVQPKDFDSYWEYYTFREDSSKPSGRYGYVELFTQRNYEGIGLKLYHSNYNLSNTPIYRVRSIRLHGNIVSRLCYGQEQNCSNYVLITEDTPNVENAPHGVVNLIAPHSSAMVMNSSDMSKQPTDFARAFLNHGPTHRRNSYFKWAKSGKGTTHVAGWPGDCYEACNSDEAKCRDGSKCFRACHKNMCAYMERVNRAGYRWAGDSSIVFLGGHGSFYNKDSVSAARIELTHCNSCNHSMNQFSSSHDRAEPLCEYPWTRVEDRFGRYGHRWGNFNTDWIVTTGCNSLGSASVPFVADGSSLLSSVIARAWRSLLMSGVHGIGGFYKLSYWRSQPWDDTGDELADDFWSDLVTKSFAQAWGEVSERFLFRGNRVIYYMVACPTTLTVAQCISRMNNDYYHGYQTGPQPDLVNHADLRFHIEKYEP